MTYLHIIRNRNDILSKHFFTLNHPNICVTYIQILLNAFFIVYIKVFKNINGMRTFAFVNILLLHLKFILYIQAKKTAQCSFDGYKY